MHIIWSSHQELYYWTSHCDQSFAQE